MHFYPFHIADYRSATDHLDLIEDCVYRRLIDLYMDTESPIQNDLQQITRRLRLGSSGLILETVLAEFFTLDPIDNCWHHARCDAEITKYRHLADIARTNGKLGGRPKKTQTVIADNPEITQTKPAGLQPRTNNQEPISTQAKACVSKQANRRTILRDDFYPNETGIEKARAAGVDIAAELQNFSDHHKSKGNLMADWQAAWRTWVANAKRFRTSARAGPTSIHDERARTIAVLTGKENIDGTGRSSDIPGQCRIVA